MAYQEMGFLPEAMVNYLVRLGWSHGDQEVFTRKELIENFSLENVGKSAAVFNMEKLLWLNGLYIRQEAPQKLAALLMPFLEKKGLVPRSEAWLIEVIKTLQERAKTLVEMADMAGFYFRGDFEYDEKAVQKHFQSKSKEPLEMLAARLEANPELDEKGLEEIFKEIVAAKGIKLGELAQPVRLALTGRSVSPGIYEILKILGKEEVMKRLTRALKKVSG
jgi:glutamyl-tRNA synthetase